CPSTPSPPRPPPPWASTRTAPSWPVPMPGWSPAGPAAQGPCPWGTFASPRRRHQTGAGDREEAGMASIDLWWLPLGAGGWFVTLNGGVYEPPHPLVEHRRPL